MIQKNHLISTLALFSFFTFTYGSNCDNLYAKVTYSLSHSKKAMTATNFEHQMYYAERALVALEKSKEYQAECSCAKSEDKTLDAIEVLEKAIEPRDWEAGRFYTKKSIALIDELITVIDECTQNSASTTVNNPDSEMENEGSIEKGTTVDDEMIKAFDLEAKAKLDSAKVAIKKLVLFSKAHNPTSGEENNLSSRYKKYIEDAKKILEEGIQNLEKE